MNEIPASLDPYKAAQDDPKEGDDNNIGPIEQQTFELGEKGQGRMDSLDGFIESRLAVIAIESIYRGSHRGRRTCQTNLVTSGQRR